MAKPVRGQRINAVPAKRLDNALQAGDAFQRNKATASNKLQSMPFPANSWIMVKNVTGDNLLQYSVLSLGNLLADFSYANGNLSFYRNACEADYPDSDSRFPVIIQKAAVANEIVPACVLGLTFARVNTGGTGDRVKVSTGSGQLVRTVEGGIGEIVGNATAISLVKLEGGVVSAKRVYGTIATAGSVCATSCTINGVVGIDNPFLGADPLTVQNPMGFPLCVGGYVMAELEWNGDYIITSIVPATAVVDVFVDGSGIKQKKFGCFNASGCATTSTIDTWSECP